MAVTNNATLVEDHETAPTYTSIGGGQGAASNANFFFRGILSSFRKMSGVTKNGFWFSDATSHDLSASGTHVKMFINAITQSGLTDFWIRIGSGQSDYEEHNVGVGFYDTEAGGWIPVWVEVDAGVDTGTPLFNAVDEWAILCDMNTISGNVKNFGTEQTHFATRPVMLWDGTTGDLDDFITTEATAGVGMLKLLNGIFTCFANFKVGSSTSTTFDMAGKTIAFPDATWLPSASVWMGIDFDLAHASTVIDATGGAILSGNPTGASARKPSVIVTGTAGAVDFSNRSFDGLRVLVLTSGVTINNASIANTGQVNATGADMSGTSIVGSTAGTGAKALLWNVNTDPDGLLDDMTIEKGAAAHHAIEFGAGAPLTMTIRGMTATGFNAADANTDSTFRFADRGSDSTWTVNVIGGTGNFSFFKARSGDTVNIVIDPVTVTVTTQEKDGTAVGSTNLVLHVSNGTGPYPFQETIAYDRSGTTVTVTHTTHGLASGDLVWIEEATELDAEGVYSITVTDANTYTYTTTGSADTSENEGKSTYVLMKGLSNATTGILSMSKTFASDQPVIGRAAKGTSAPFWEEATLVGVVDSLNGLPGLIGLMLPDE